MVALRFAPFETEHGHRCWCLDWYGSIIQYRHIVNNLQAVDPVPPELAICHYLGHDEPDRYPSNCNERQHANALGNGQ